MITAVLLTIVILLAAIFTAVSRTKYTKYPPGPFRWPIVGNKFLLSKLTTKLGGQHLAFLELCRQYRSDLISLRLGYDNIVVVSGTKYLHDLHYNESFDGRPWNEFAKLRNMGLRKGITMNDGPEWKYIRAWLVRTLKTLGFGSHKMSNMITDETAVVIDKLKGGGVHELKSVFSPIVINVLWMLATNRRLGDDPRLEHFKKLMAKRTRAFDMTGGTVSQFPWLRYIAPELTGYNVLKALNEDIKVFLLDTIAEHKKKYKPNKEVDVIDMFIREQYTQQNTSMFTDDQLVMILLDLFFAGIATTTMTLDFVFLNMVVYQDVQEKLHKEIDEVIGTDRLPNLADRVRLPYTEAVLTESQRMWTVTPITGPRRVLRTTNLGGYTIPKDTYVLMNIYTNNMDPDLCPEPEKFKPERFIVNDVFTTDENLILFGKGKRRCPGETLAKSALFLIFVGIMQKYKLLPVPGQEPPTMNAMPGLNISPRPYNVLVVPR